VIDDDADSLVKVQVGDRFYSPIDLSFYPERIKTTRRTYFKNTGY
jgi:hypothetical protein